MTDPSLDPTGEVRSALRAIVADPQLGAKALSSRRTMSNILSDYLPDAPREATILIAASDADVIGQLRTYLDLGMDATVAQGIVASGFVEQTALTLDACQWAVHEIAIALGVSPHEGFATVRKPPEAPARPQPVEDVTVIPAPPPPAPPPPAPPQYPVQQQPYRARPALLPYDQAVAPRPTQPQTQPPKRRHNALVIILSVTIVPVVIIAIFVAVFALIPTAPTRKSPAGLATSVPAKTLGAVGAGKAYSDAFTRITDQSPLSRNGKPEVLYIGAAFCPYCAANQWAIIVALSQFGTFSGLTPSRSAPSPEKYPNTATLTFDRASYSSKYLTFVPVESEDVHRHELQPTTKLESRLWNRYARNDWPFTDIGNDFWAESLFDPAILQGKTQRQIASALANPSSPVAQAVDGAANRVVAAICEVTGNEPEKVCLTPAIAAIERGA